MADRDTSRRAFLKGVGAGAAWAGIPYVALGRRRETNGSDEEVLSGAQERIKRHRRGRAVLTLIGPEGRPLPAGVSVEIHLRRHKFLFGCNIFKLGRCRTEEDNAAYASRFSELLNFATLPFYWWMYERRRGRPEDERTEQIVRWCQAHEITTKGHPLAWNWAEPPWLAGATPEEAMELQTRRIGRCVERFKGDIDIWDVVNEATHYDRQNAKDRAPRLTEAISRMGVGKYVRTAFQTARRANPAATLLINDYRRDLAYADKVISELVDENGEPLYDVIGIQSHMHGAYLGAAQIWEACERFARFGKPLHFTETTVVSGPKRDSGWNTTPAGEKRQAELVSEFYTLLYSHPAVEAITWWDFTDQNAWQQAPAGLVREDMTPKPAYENLHGLIKGKWWTRATVRTGPDGRAVFDGSLGHYEVRADVNGGRMTGRFSLDDSGEMAVTLQRA